MNRRGFLAGATAVVAAVPNVSAAAVGKPGGLRLSRREDDPGYRAYCIARGDGKTVKCFLNGVEQRFVVTADESIGMMFGGVETPEGNIAHDGENFLEETRYGDVRIVIE